MFLSIDSKPTYAIGRWAGALFGMLGMYMGAWFAYYGALAYTSGGKFSPFWRTGLDYGLKALWTIPVWWFIFKILEKKPSWMRYFTHTFTLPLWIFLWLKSYYYLCDAWELGRLGGPGVGWDIYIPALFYAIQFGVFHIYDESKRLVAQKVKAAELQALSVKSELAALKAQLNPHFLYNVFNTINASLPPDQEDTREMIAQLSDLFRYQLRASRSETVPLKDELDFVRSYLELEQARFQERLQVVWEIAPGLDHVEMPPMLLQPLVENAIKHGISPKVEGGTITIRIQPHKKHIRFAVLDDGIGFKTNSAQAGEGVGLHNASRILDALYDTKLEVIKRPENGVEVSFNLPQNESR
ncbi:MAG: sensor histidine kinase [Bacteroidia bacterium]